MALYHLTFIKQQGNTGRFEYWWGGCKNIKLIKNKTSVLGGELDLVIFGCMRKTKKRKSGSQERRKMSREEEIIRPWTNIIVEEQKE